MTINRSEIMKAAWVRARGMNPHFHSLRARLSLDLRTEWAIAKIAAADAAAAPRPTSPALDDIRAIESSADVLTAADVARIADLRAAAYA